MIHRFFITTGNIKGVGLEISLKAFLNSSNEDSIIIMCNEEELKRHSKIYNHKFNDLNIIEDISKPLEPGVFFYTKGTPFDWFASSVDLASNDPLNSAVITGPISKDHFLDDNINGHTSYLESQFKDYDLFMTFLGSVYNCLLLTDHTPLLKLSEDVISKRLNKALKLIDELKDVLELNKKIGVLGLNPHAGENGLIGHEESRVHKKILKDFKYIEGPLSGDGFFSKEEYEKYSLIIANYHDQGLIPFKLLHGFNGCQTTLGLPFVRTSVNHGTAEDLYLKNTASEASLLHAYQTAKKLLRRGINQNDL